MKRYVLTLCIPFLILSACKSGPANNADPRGDSKTAQSIAHPKLPVAQGTPRILFIGNSHTEFYTSLPTLFSELCAANNQPIAIDRLITMGVSIQEIYDDHKTEAEKDFEQKDADGNYYDYVVLQEKTPVALSEPAQYKANTRMICEKIRKNSPGAAIYIYEGMSPVPFTNNKEEYNQYYEEMRKNALDVMKDCGNAGLLRMADAVKDAYEGKENYAYQVAGKDNLRFGENTLHVLNDGGFLSAVLLYTTIFDKKPAIPATLTLSKGTGDNDGMEKMAVARGVSNAAALASIAYNNR